MPVSSSDRLDAVRSAFDQWRAAHSKHARIPSHLWLQAVSLLDSFPLSVVARHLHLNTARLRRHINASSLPSQPPESDQRFVQIPAPDLTFSTSSATNTYSNTNHHSLIHSDASTLRLTMERPDGSRLCLAVPAANFSLLESLCSAFFRSR